MAESLSSFLASEAELITEAAHALPHQFSDCTYALGHIRQAVYLCLTCELPRGICSSCSIACHTDHEQVELFPKRNFRCDCPTEALPHPCTLHTRLEPENGANSYSQNFEGMFCRCGRPYDVKAERETMIQCLACEDWYHESCLNLRERPPSREPTPAAPADANLAKEPQSEVIDDGASVASSSGLPPPLVTDEAYDSLVCRSCVLANPTIRRWAGTSGAMMVVRDNLNSPWRILDGSPDHESLPATNGHINDADVEPSVVGSKRSHDESLLPVDDAQSQPKRARVESAVSASEMKKPCLAPPPQVTAQNILASFIAAGPGSDLGAGDVFFTEGWRSRWCDCDSCLPSLQAQPFLLEEEETFEPPEDPDSGFSLEELGMRALQRLPRDRALDGIRAFNEMRDDLLQYLRPFAREGKTVNDEDIKKFFEARTEAMSLRRASDGG